MLQVSRRHWHQCYYPNLYPRQFVWLCLYMFRNLYPICLLLLLSLTVSVAVWLTVSVGISELSGLVAIPTCVRSSLADCFCRNLCLSYLVLLLSQSVSLAVWLALPVGICVWAIWSVAIPTCVCSMLASFVCRNLCLICMVLWLSLPVPLAVWLSLPVGIFVWAIWPCGIPTRVCSSLAGCICRICVWAICSYGYPSVCL